MSFNKKQVLLDNINAIEHVLSGGTDKTILSNYQGFGGLKSILLDPSNPNIFPESDIHLIPLVIQFHEVLKKFSASENEYKKYYDSIRRSVLSSFYTPEPIVHALSDILSENHLNIERLLDPSSGTGIFLKIPSTEKIAFEKDLLTGKILKALSPDADIYISSFEDSPRKLENTFDLVTSNIPFGDIVVFDPIYYKSKEKERKNACSKIHHYFFLKGGDMAREGGIIALITSAGMMDSPSHESFRKYLLKTNNLISAIRLPENLFKDSSGIEVKSDLIILQKNSKRGKLHPEEIKFIKSNNINGININSYYENLQSVIHTKIWEGTNQYGKPDFHFSYDGTINEMGEKIKIILRQDFQKKFNPNLFAEKPMHIEKEHVQITDGQLLLFDEFFKKKENPSQQAEIKKESVVKEQKAEIFEYTYQKNIQEGSLVLSEDLKQKHIGKVFNLENREAKEIRFSPKDEEKIRQYIRVRDSYYALEKYEKTSGVESSHLRDRLNIEYDILEKSGGINEDKALFSIDPSFKEIRSLEIRKNGKYDKADIFFEPVAFKKDEEPHTIEQAYYECLNKFNEVNIDYITSLSNTTEENVLNELRGTIYFNPLRDAYESANILLSGNVVEKYENIRTISEGLNERRVFDTLKALKESFPTLIPFEDIGINIGERWIPDVFYSDFAKKLLNENVKIKYNDASDEFIIQKDKWSPQLDKRFYIKAANGRTYTGNQILSYALRDNIPSLTKTIVNDGVEVKIPDAEAIQKMHLAIETIKNEFQQYLFSLPEDKKSYLENLYNNKFNCFVKTKFDGAFQSFPGLELKNLGYSEVKPSQKEAIAMIKSNMGGVVDHEVGNGKTLVMCIAAQELKRLNIANKPLIICMNANIGAIADTYKKAYPLSKILSSTDENMVGKEREEYYAKINNNNWDCIIMTHGQFAKIPQSSRMEKQIIDDELDKLRKAMRELGDLDEKDQRIAEKNLLRKEAKLETRLEMIEYNLSLRKDSSILDFETMNIDHIMVDESHLFKNLQFSTKHNRVAGLGNQEGSDRAFNLLLALRTIQDRSKKDLGATFLSGTVLSNSLTELYSLFNYLRPKALLNQGLSSFDAWAATYTKKDIDFEFNVVNQVVQKERFRFFVKVPELAMFYSEITDYKTAKEAGIEKPVLNEVLLDIEQTSEQKEMFARLQQFAKTGDGTIIFREKLSESELKAQMLIATNTAKKASLDVRLIDENMFSDNERNKTSICSKKVWEYYKKYDAEKGTQFIFSDLGTPKNSTNFSVYTDLKNKLIELGINKDEIRFVHEFKSTIQRDKMCQMMNEGKIRILLGSTEKLGTGINAQDRVVAIHHLDIPWKPSDMEQRNGRGVRQGNWVAKQFCNNQVDIFIYAVKQSLDNYKFNLLKNKATFIGQIKTQNIGSRQIDEGGLDENNGMNFAEYISILSGNTDFLEKAKIENKISVLKSEEQLFYKEVRRIEESKINLSSNLTTNKSMLLKLTSDHEKFNSIPRDENGEIIYKIEIGGKEYDNKKVAGEALNIALKTTPIAKDYLKIGKFYDFEVLKQTNQVYSIDGTRVDLNKVYIGGEHVKYSFNYGNLAETAEIAGEYPIKALSRISSILDQHVKENIRMEERLRSLPINNGEWKKQDQLVILQSELNQITERIKLNVNEEAQHQFQNFRKEKDTGFHI